VIVGDYKCIDNIGEGSFGKIYKGISTKDENMIVAMKVISKKKIQK
jgi:serine/threonine protein kinase